MISPHLLEQAASKIKITVHSTSERRPWVPNVEQIEAWRTTCSNRLTFIAKSRQVGLTTSTTLEDVLHVGTNDRIGNRIRCAIVVDTDEKTRERILLAGDMATQLGFAVKSATTERVTFRNGSEIVGITAGGNRAGASTSFQRLHISELPFWPNPDAFGSLLPSLSLNGKAVIETTLDVAAPSGQFARDLWRNPSDWCRLFLPVEMHGDYQSEKPISDDQWLEQQAEGYTSRTHASWFIHEAIPNRCGGDKTRAFREYPQVVEHMFQAAETRFVRVTPIVTKPVRHIRVPSATGNELVSLVYREAKDCSHRIVIGVDTATGKERDRSTIVVIDKNDCCLVATFVSDTVDYDDLARVLLVLQTEYVRTGFYGDVSRRVPVAIIEDNGIGDATVKAAHRLGVVFRTQTTTESSKLQGLLEAKRAIESGAVFGPPELAEECDKIHRDRLGRFKGRKDLLMAIGFCLIERRLSPGTDERPTEAPPPTFDVKKRIRLAARGGQGGGGWV